MSNPEHVKATKVSNFSLTFHLLLHTLMVQFFLYNICREIDLISSEDFYISFFVFFKKKEIHVNFFYTSSLFP